MVGLGGAVLLGGVLLSRCSRRDDPTAGITGNSLDLQKSRGAYLDAGNEHLTFPDAVPGDASGYDQLASDLRPHDLALVPFYVPTLFQSLAAQNNDTLRADFQPIDSPAMRQAFLRGAAVRELLEHAERPDAWLLVVDLPGPESVAFAAGLQPMCETVFVFDNWPHPRGVVPAHLTLAAAVYHRAAFRDAARPTPHATAFVLDRRRLAAYQDEPDRFDNRYVARLPPADALRARGIERILYVVTGDAEAVELDDLNARFVDYRDNRIDVRMLGLGDLTLGDAPKNASGATGQQRPYWHGSPFTHWFFWSHYGWPSRSSGITPQQPATSSFGSTWSPNRRSTRFDRGVAGFGQTRTQPSGGRSGSWGRSGSGSSS